MRIFSSIRAAAEWVERAPISIAAFAGSFAAIIAIRHLLEMITASYPTYSPVQFFVHYPLAYVAPLLALTLLLSLFSGERVERVMRLMLLAWLLTLLPPLFDIALGLPHRQQIGYLVGADQRFFPLMLRFLDPRVELPGTTRGIRIETAIACLLGFAYVRMKGKGWLRASACGLLLLPVCLIFFTLPVRFYRLLRPLIGDIPITTLFDQPGRIISIEAGETEDMVIVSYLVPLVLLLLGVFLRRPRRAEATDAGAAAAVRFQAAWIGPLASLRALQPAVCACAGAFVARVIAAPAPPGPAPAEGVAIFSIGFSCLLGGAAFALPLRAAPGGATEPLHPREAPPAYFSLALAGLSLALASSLGTAPLALVTVLLAVATLEAMPPFVLARWPGLGEAWGALGGIVATLAGLSVFFGREVIVRTPPSLALAVFTGGVLLRAAGRPGEGFVRVFRALAAALAPLAFPLLLGEPTLALPLILIGGAGALVVFAGSTRFVATAVPAAICAAFLAGGLLLLQSPRIASRLHGESLRSPYLHLRIGNTALSRGDLETASKAYRAALERNPRFVPALYQLGQVMLRQEDLKAAIEQFSAAVRADPADTVSLTALGAALRSSGDAPGALERFEMALARDPGNCHARFNRASTIDELSGADSTGPPSSPPTEEQLSPRDAARAWREFIDHCADRPEQSHFIAQARQRIEELEAGR